VSGVVQNRRPSQICGLERVADSGIIAPRRNTSAHLHRLWRANKVRQLDSWRCVFGRSVEERFDRVRTHEIYRVASNLVNGLPRSRRVRLRRTGLS
jgi:hypothetical protein